MRIRTVQPGDYNDYLALEYPVGADGSAEARAADEEERRARLAAFPFVVVLQVSYPERTTRPNRRTKR